MFAAPRGVRSLGQFDTKWKTARGRSSHELLRGSTGAAGQLVTSNSTDLIYMAGMAALDRPIYCRSGNSTPNRTGFAWKPRRHARTIATRAPKSKATTKTKPYDDPKLASHVLYLSANNFADGFVPFNANDTSSCVTRFSPINF